jgi:hypothetical protein
MTTYVVIPWDVQSCNPDISCFPELPTLEEAAKRLAGPADIVLALDNGLERQLSGSEKNQLERLMGNQPDKIGRLGVRGISSQDGPSSFAHTCADYPPQPRMPGSSINMDCPACFSHLKKHRGGTA